MTKEKLYKKYKTTFFPGEKVEWTYKHWLNSKSYTLITKQGVFIREISRRLTVQEMHNLFLPRKKALVRFDGNKNPSRVLVEELKHVLPFDKWLEKYKKEIKII